jgi:hypothetical protein
MPNYFLHAERNGRRIVDPEGAHFADLDAAIEEANFTAWELAADNLRHTGHVDAIQIDIADETGAVLAVVHFPVTEAA